MEIKTDSKIYKRKDGRWCVSYYGMETNARRHYLYGKTKSEVKLKLAELEHPIQSQQQDVAVRNVEKEEPVIEVSSVESEAESKEDAMVKLNGANSDAGTKWTLQAWVRYYLETYKKNEIKETTFDSYMGIYRRRIAKSKIGKSKLEDLTGDDLQKEYNQMVGDGCKASTIRHLFILINMALNRAVQLRYIMENPNQLVTLPRKNRFEGKTLTAEEARRIFEKAKDDELYPIVALTLCTGLRKGDDDDKIRLNQRKPSKYKGLSRFGPEKNLQRINKFMKERPTFYKKLIQMKENFRFYLRCFYCITKVVILQFNSEKQDRISS